MDLDFTGERQVGKTLNDVEIKHLKRYYYAKEKIEEFLSKDKLKIADVGCGIGYGSFILSELNCSVDSYDISEDAINFANKYYKKDNINYYISDCSNPDFITEHYDAIISFEFLEHLELEESKAILRKIIEKSDLAIVSIPINKPSEFHKIVMHENQITNHHKRILEDFPQKKIKEKWIQRNIFHITVIGNK